MRIWYIPLHLDAFSSLRNTPRSRKPKNNLHVTELAHFLKEGKAVKFWPLIICLCNSVDKLSVNRSINKEIHTLQPWHQQKVFTPLARTTAECSNSQYVCLKVQSPPRTGYPAGVWWANLRLRLTFSHQRVLYCTTQLLTMVLHALLLKIWPQYYTFKSICFYLSCSRACKTWD